MAERKLQEMISMAVKRFRCLALCIFLLCVNLAAVPAGSAETTNGGGKEISLPWKAK